MNLEEATKQPDMTKLSLAAEPETRSAPAMMPGQSFGFLICTMPLIFAQPDNLNQFTRQGIPQYRLIPPFTS